MLPVFQNANEVGSKITVFVFALSFIHHFAEAAVERTEQCCSSRTCRANSAGNLTEPSQKCIWYYNVFLGSSTYPPDTRCNE